MKLEKLFGVGYRQNQVETALRFVVCPLLVPLLLAAGTASADGPLSGGTVKKNQLPLVVPVCTAADLDRVRLHLAGNYKQVCNIDLNNYPFEPIGGYLSGAFSGQFDGNGYSISNFSFSDPERSMAGLFGWAENAVIKNVNLTNISISASAAVGGLVGYAFNTRIINPRMFGTVTGSNSQIGGVVGFLNEGLVTNAHASVQVSPAFLDHGHDLGGIVGYAQSATIENSTVTGTIKGISKVGGLLGSGVYTTIEHSNASVEVFAANSAVGGLVGDLGIFGIVRDSSSSGLVSYLSLEGYPKSAGGLVGLVQSGGIIERSHADTVTFGSDSAGGLIGKITSNGVWTTLISDCYARGNVISTSNFNAKIGGLIGLIDHAGVFVRNAYSIGMVVADSPFAGGLVGFSGAVGEEVVENSYFDIQTSGQTVSAGGEGRTTVQMQHESNYAGWDFETVWEHVNGAEYPRLRSN